MGQKIILADANFTAPGLVVLRDDPVLSIGSLFLFDPGHSLGSFLAIPSNGTSVPNVAWKEAAAIIGSGSKESLSGIVASLNPNEASKMITERTAKGGLHGLISHVNQTAANNWTVYLPADVQSHIHSNPGHLFYFSIWYKVTRAGLSGASNQSPFHYFSTGSNFLFYAANGTPTAAGTNKHRIANTTDDGNAAPGDNIFLSIGPSGITGTGPTAGDKIAFGVGDFQTWGSLNINKAPSRIIYRVYAEDLTISGRNYGDVKSIDNALFTTAFAAGGKFYSDTYTDPATLP